MIQSSGQNHLGGADVVNNTYSFSGELTASNSTHIANGSTTRIANRYEYDHMGRKVSAFAKINSHDEVQLSHLIYNELGQLMEKKLHNDSQGTTFAYNERCCLKGSTSDQFSMRLNYTVGAATHDNGNIANQYWGTGSNPMANAFSYSYDRLNRLVSATSPNLGENISYDVMGNITSLSRDGYGTNSYTGYNGNKLTNINGFTNSVYGYDANGNLHSDSSEGRFADNEFSPADAKGMPKFEATPMVHYKNMTLKPKKII